jgi:hypothetical protein
MAGRTGQQSAALRLDAIDAGRNGCPHHAAAGVHRQCTGVAIGLDAGDARHEIPWVASELKQKYKF